MLNRTFNFACDFCAATKSQERYGLPDGWISLNASVLKNTVVRHACPQCRDNIPRVEWHKLSLDKYEA